METDSAKMICGCQPKYLDILPENSRGLLPKLIAKIDPETKIWRHNFYIVRCEFDNEYEVLGLEKKIDILRIDANTDIVRLEKYGINISKIDPEISAYEPRDRAVTLWLIEEEKILSEVLN